MATSAMVEVITRNAMDLALTKWAHDVELHDWLDAPVLDQKIRNDVARARRRGRGGRLGAPPRPIPDLSFGFWRYLAARRHLTTLWLPSLRNAFPHGSTDLLARRREVHFALQQLVFVRNRAAHHEPIHNRPLMNDYRLAVGLASMIDPSAGEWVTEKSTIPAIVAAKPLMRA